MEYEAIIGLEVHIQSKTKSKMFCSCSSEYFGAKPNTHTCPVCLGLPGAMPVPNKDALDKCVKLTLGLHCEISKETKFDRKNYFYPDLPKGYQISQYDQPIGYNGYMEIEVNDGMKKIGITRVHQEEDTGKSIHQGDKTLLDFNKSGVPLIEVVSEPDLRSVEEVNAYAKLLHQTVRYLGISDADMEKGQMRFELNISLRPKGFLELPNYKVEVKNIGSISVLQKVVESEIERQSNILDKGETPIQETRGLLDMHGNTASQRLKETSDDYRYFPEPDIPPIEFTEEYIENLRSELDEGPSEKASRYITDFGIQKYVADVIVADRRKMKLFEETSSLTKDKDLLTIISKLIIGPYASIAKEDIEILPEQLFDVAKGINDRSIPYGATGMAGDILRESASTGTSVSEIIEQKGLMNKISEDDVCASIDKVIQSNSKVVDDVKRNPNAVMFLVGQVMKESKGKADPSKVKELIEEAIRDR